MNCDACGEYGDIICTDCMINGIILHFCDICIESHMDWHERQDEQEEEASA